MADYVTGVSLDGVRKLVDDKLLDDSIIDAIDGILSLAVVVSPVVAGPAALPLLGLLEWKNEAVKLAREAIKKLTKAQPRDYLEQAAKMAAANCLLTYTAYFDALQTHLPGLLESVNLSEAEKNRIIGSNVGKESNRHPLKKLRHGRRHESESFSATDLANQVISMPHPAVSSSDTDTRLELYQTMSENLLETLSARDEIWAPLSVDTRERIREVIMSEIPHQASAMYDAEFLGIAIDSQRFFLWSVLTDQSEKDKLIGKLGTDVRAQFELVGSAIASVDIGLQRLSKAIYETSQSSIPAPLDRGLGQVASELHSFYMDAIEQPIIDDTYSVDDSAPQLSYPTKVESFVPQGFRTAVYREKMQHLELEASWRELPVNEELGPFLVAHLESPYSVQIPLLILGHPGSGKSLLTEVVAARLAYPAYTTIRVELRDIDPDTEIQSQIETQIYKDTGREVNWVDFAGNLLMSPPVVIFDGYDELIQATGKLHADYLDRIRKFQHREAVVHHRPVRVIVTSRITLIDKAIIPPGTTIVRLEEFDRTRREAWSGVWNGNNDSYFRQVGIQPFSLPANPKVEELARQPLLLLMLALYDSSANKLSAEPDIDQTRLYNELLARFIERELAKGKDGVEFLRLSEDERQAQIDRELQRLGVAAIGMFNRQTLVIQREELDADLAYFDAQRDKSSTGARALSQADLLLGSFFFIHESRSRQADDVADSTASSSAFEFLHNTFGEFLAADFILRKVIEEADTVRQLMANPKLNDSLKRELTGLPESWFACLIHTPLHTRPVILNMLKEWGGHRLAGSGSGESYLHAIDEIVLAQLRSFLTDPTLPPLSVKDSRNPYTPLPALGQIAVYTLNLVLLRSYLSTDTYVLNESLLDAQLNGGHPWDRLTSLWRSWFPSESLSALASQITVTRRENSIAVKSDGSRLATQASTSLTAAYNTALALADDLTTVGLGLHLTELLALPENYLSGLRARARGGIGSHDFVPIIDLASARNSRHQARRLSIFLGRHSPRFLNSKGQNYESSFPNSLPPGNLLGFSDIADRVLLSPSQRSGVSIGPSRLDQFAMLSRYSAELAVSQRVALEPRWLPHLLLRNESVQDRSNLHEEFRKTKENPRPENSRTRSWSSLLAGPAAAPALRGALLHFVEVQHTHLATRIQEVFRDSPVNLFDVDTAAAIASVAWRGGLIDLCLQVLDIIIESCEGKKWMLLDIPDQLWPDFTDLLRSSIQGFSSRRVSISRILDKEIPNLIKEPRRSGFSSAGIAIHALNIGSKEDKQIIDYLILRAFDSSTLVDVRHRSWLLMLMRWALENSKDKIMRDLTSKRVRTQEYPETGSKFFWKYLLGIPDEQDFYTLDVDSVSRHLTEREASDLRWIVSKMRQARVSGPGRASSAPAAESSTTAARSRARKKGPGRG